MYFCVSDWEKKEESRYDRDRERKSVLIREWERKRKKESDRNTDREWKSVRERERQQIVKRVWEREFDCITGREVCVWVC